MTNLRCLQLIACLALIHAPQVCGDEKAKPAPAAVDAAALAELAEFIRPYRATELAGRFDGVAKNCKLILTAIEGDEPAGDRATPSLDHDKLVRYGCQIAQDGQLQFFYHSSRGTKGSGYPTISSEDLRRLDGLVARLIAPPRLPPHGRRLVIQMAGADEFKVLVYDRANLPAEVLELLRLSQSGIRSYVPEFKPTAEWEAHRYTETSVLALSPDGKSLVTACQGDSLKTWNPATQKEIGKSALPLHTSPTEMAYSPDRSLAAMIAGWSTVQVLATKDWQHLCTFEEPELAGRYARLSHPQFSADGRRLMLSTSMPMLRIVDAATGEHAERPPDLPPDVLAYFSANKSRRAVYLASFNVVALWDEARKAKVATLDDSQANPVASIVRVTFSPDDSQVAVATVHPGPGGHPTRFRLRLWNAETGSLLHELRPFEQSTCEDVEGLLWTNDGKYVMAATKAHSFFTSHGISIWEASSGRHRGELVGCPTNVNGLVLLPEKRLAAGCRDGRVRIWDLAPALERIRDLEHTFDVAR